MKISPIKTSWATIELLKQSAAELTADGWILPKWLQLMIEQKLLNELSVILQKDLTDGDISVKWETSTTNVE